MKRKVMFLALAMAIIASAASAGVVTASLTAPTVDGEDIANLSGIDKDGFKCFSDGPVAGQTFVTGDSPVLLNAITYQLTATNGATVAGDKTYAFRVGTVDPVNGGAFNVVASDTAVQDYEVNASEYMTFTFDTPVELAANTVYGIDVGMTDSTTSWTAGIPYFQRTNNDGDGYVDGLHYSSGDDGIGGDTISISMGGGGRDMDFHLDISAVPEPATMCLLGLGGLLLRRKR